MEYSVLMSVYFKEKPEYLKKALDSMLSQTEKPSQLVLVCDGKLTPELEKVIEERSGELDVVRLPENKGLGNALKIGLEHCENELVARMDTDDISVPDRCRKQLSAFDGDSELAVLSGAVEEFTDDPEQPLSKRPVPLTHEEILRYSKRRNPFNHPAVMFRKSAVLNAGGYSSDFNLFEDYDLWSGVLQSGVKTANLPDVLVKMRTPADFYKRRGGRPFAKKMIRFRKSLRKSGKISRRDYIFSTYPHAAVCVMPAWMRKGVYKALRAKERN